MIEMYAALLEDGGYTVEVKPVENRELYAPELESGTIDVVPEYAATLAEFLNRDVNGPDAEPIATGDVEETIEAMRPLAEEKGLEVLEPAEAANQNAFFVTEQFATENDLTTLSDLGALGQPIVLAGTQECPERPKCELGLEEVYGLDVTEDLPLGFGTVQNKQAVVEGDAQLGLSGTTDGTLGDLGLVVLEDDKSLQNADNLVPVVNAEGPAGHRRGRRGAERPVGGAHDRGPRRAQPPRRRGPRGGRRGGEVLPRGAGPARVLTCAHAGTPSPTGTSTSRTLPGGARGHAQAGSYAHDGL